MSDYNEIYNWAYAVAKEVLEGEYGDKQLKNLYYAIRGEEVPGRFFERLARELGDLKFASELEVSGKKELLTHMHGDSFHLARAAIILGLINAAAGRKKPVKGGMQ